MLLPLTLNKFADALCLVPAPARATEAQAIIAEAEAMAVKHGALHGRDYGWGHFVEPACYARQNAYRIAHRVQSAPHAALTDRDGLQAYAVALAALDAMVVAAEDRVAA
jgi:hypothetical protein